MNMPGLLIRIARLRRRLYDTDNPEKRLKLSRELDRLLNDYYRLKTNPIGIF
ncbi:MAG: Spo0E family sporulation regulatory protein-aspartic acid phosphatase [Peptococcaceae bacterium]|nr:Spo0E family sporulation regulatory protein-aspartic acid phosphatase [Peptococcaceae bacterium]